MPLVLPARLPVCCPSLVKLVATRAVICLYSICVVVVLEERTIERQQTIGRILEMLASGERHVHTFLRVSLKHFQVRC